MRSEKKTPAKIEIIIATISKIRAIFFFCSKRFIYNSLLGKLYLIVMKRNIFLSGYLYYFLSMLLSHSKTLRVQSLKSKQG